MPQSDQTALMKVAEELRSMQLQNKLQEAAILARMVVIDPEQCDKFYTLHRRCLDCSDCDKLRTLRKQCLDPSIVVAPVPRAIFVPYVIPLNDEDDDLEKDGDPQESKCSRASASVVFDKVVSVFSIPHRKDYTTEMKNALWSDRREIQENAERNLIEWTAEGFDWRKVVEDEDFIELDGEMVHPVHDKVTLPSPPPSPIKKGLPKPIPHRPKHPSLHSNDFISSSWDPIIRPTNPFPF